MNWGTSDSLLPIPLIQNVGEVTSLAVSGDFLYWVEKDKAVLFWVTISGAREVSWISLSSISSAADIFHLAISDNSPTSLKNLNMACTTANCSHFCVPKDDSNSFTCVCPNNVEADADGSCNITPTHCPQPSRFSCGDGQCVPQSFVCDGGADCANGNDEANCTTLVKICDEENQKQCANGDCLSKAWWCDGDADCTDGSDENEECPNVECSDGRWRCKDKKQCVVERWRCDGDADCRDESDEEDCEPKECAASQFQCTDGQKCIRMDWQCDQVPDCHDASDEVNCTYTNSCSRNEYHCNNGDCVDMDLVCDGEEDCGDGSDELAQLCHTNRTDPPILTTINCGTDFQCGFLCLPSSARCNGTWECSDYSDEKGCDMCTSDTFRCTSGDMCVPRTSLCDGEQDCADGSDERDCKRQEDDRQSRMDDEVSDKCEDSEFKCISGECLPLEKVCDERHDCLDGDDEGALCNNACTSSHPCGPEQVCLPTPRGPVCKCKDGFSLSPLGLCEDVDECLRISSCSQLCTNTKGSFKCGCEEGYEVEGRQCRALGVKNQLFLYAVGNHIKGLLAGLGGQQVYNCIKTE